MSINLVIKMFKNLREKKQDRLFWIKQPLASPNIAIFTIWSPILVRKIKYIKKKYSSLLFFGHTLVAAKGRFDEFIL